MNEIIDVLQDIKNRCEDNVSCHGCPFYCKEQENDDFCGIKALVKQLNKFPEDWDMAIIRGVLERD